MYVCVCVEKAWCIIVSKQSKALSDLDRLGSRGWNWPTLAQLGVFWAAEEEEE